MADNIASRMGLLGEYRAWQNRKRAEAADIQPDSGEIVGAISGIGRNRPIGNPDDPRLTQGEAPQPAQIPGLPDPIQENQRIEALLARNLPYGAGIYPVSRGEAEFAYLRDGQMQRNRYGEAGRWTPTSDRDAAGLEFQANLNQAINPGTAGAPRRADAPLRERRDRVIPEQIDRVVDRLEEMGVADARQDPRFVEMEQAALGIRAFPRREPYEGDPSEIGGRGENKTWGGIAPYGAIEVATTGPQGPGMRRIYPSEPTGVIETLNEDATAQWERSRDMRLPDLTRELEERARTPVITGVGLEQLKQTGRFREPLPGEMAIYGGNSGKNSLAGFIVTAGTRPLYEQQLIDAAAKGRVQVAINDGGALKALAPQELAEGLARVQQMAMDPGNPAVVVNPSGQFTLASAASLPEMYLIRPDGNMTRLAMKYDADGNTGLMFREWTPIYDPGTKTTVQRARRDSLGDDYVAEVETPLYRVGSPIKMDAASVRDELREVMPGTGSAIVMSDPMGLRKLLQAQDSGGIGVVLRRGDQSEVLTPEDTESVINALVRQAVDPNVAGITLSPQRSRSGARQVIPAAGPETQSGMRPPAVELPQLFVRRPDGREERIVVSVRPGPVPEPLFQVIREQDRQFVGPTLLSPEYDQRMAARQKDPDQDIFPFLGEVRGYGFSEEAPIASSKNIMRDLVAGMTRKGMTAEEAAGVLAQTIQQKARNSTQLEDSMTALRAAMLDLSGGETRLPAAMAGSAMGGQADWSPAAIAELGRFLKESGRRSGRVVPEGDLRQSAELRPAVNLTYEDDRIAAEIRRRREAQGR